VADMTNNQHIKGNNNTQTNNQNIYLVIIKNSVLAELLLLLRLAILNSPAKKITLPKPLAFIDNLITAIGSYFISLIYTLMTLYFLLLLAFSQNITNPLKTYPLTILLCLTFITAGTWIKNKGTQHILKLFKNHPT
jgi:hypothetical protein